MSDLPNEKRLAEMDCLELNEMLCRVHGAAKDQIPPGAEVITVVFEGDKVYFATGLEQQPIQHAAVLKMVIQRIMEISGALPTAIGTQTALARGVG